MTNSTWKKTTALLVGGLVVGGLGAGFWADDSSDVDRLTAELALANNVTPEVVTETIEVEVDNGNLDTVLQHIYDNDGSVDYLTEDLDDDEISQIVDRIVFTNEIKDLAVAEVKAEAADEIDGTHNVTISDGEPVSVDFDEDDIERVRVQDDDDEVVIDDIDFEDGDADVLVSVNFEHEVDGKDVKFVADFNVEIKDGEIDDLNLLEIKER